MESSEPSDENQQMYPPSGWLRPSYDPWINKPNEDQGMSESTSQQHEQEPLLEITVAELTVRAIKAGYLPPEDAGELAGGLRDALEVVSEYIEKAGDDPGVVLKEWGVEYPGKTE